MLSIHELAQIRKKAEKEKKKMKKKECERLQSIIKQKKICEKESSSKKVHDVTLHEEKARYEKTGDIRLISKYSSNTIKRLDSFHEFIYGETETLHRKNNRCHQYPFSVTGSCQEFPENSLPINDISSSRLTEDARHNVASKFSSFSSVSRHQNNEKHTCEYQNFLSSEDRLSKTFGIHERELLNEDLRDNMPFGQGIKKFQL